MEYPLDTPASRAHRDALAVLVAGRARRPVQARFTSMLATLIGFAEGLGYEVVLDMAKRCAECPVGHPESLHKLKLAADLNLFKDGKYLRATKDYLPLGEYWEYLGGYWGGRFGDGNHFSIEYRGMK